MSAAWERVVRAALLGTERQPAPEDAATGEPPLDAAVAALANAPAEARLLGTAALLDAWRRAGRRAAHTAAQPFAPASDVEERACSPAAAAALRQAMASGPPPLAEWLALAGQAGVAPPHELLPELLRFGLRYGSVREDVARGIGARGRWLASLNPAWAYAAGPPANPAAGWETGTAEERVRILRDLRERAPAAALELLRSTWDAEAPRDRVAFLDALSIGLGMGDEPFLEALLDDRRKEVRAAAAELLARLPASRLVARMTDRLAMLLHVHAPDGVLPRLRHGPARIEVELPAACDRAMRRDGIDPKPPHGTGERTWWLQQMLAAVPPSSWTERWGMDAAAALAAARAGAEGDALVQAWTQAAVRHLDAEWAEALLRTQAGSQGLDAVGPLAAVLPPARREPLILARLREGRLQTNEPAARMLEAGPFDWSPALTRAVLESIPRPLPPAEHMLRARMGSYALWMHPGTAAAVLREQGDPHRDGWVDRLHLRHTLHQAFA